MIFKGKYLQTTIGIGQGRGMLTIATKIYMRGFVPSLSTIPNIYVYKTRLAKEAVTGTQFYNAARGSYGRTVSL